MNNLGNSQKTVVVIYTTFEPLAQIYFNVCGFSTTTLNETKVQMNQAIPQSFIIQ